MRTVEIQELFAFNRWANARMREAVSPLTTEEFGRDMNNSFPSIRDTVLHIMTSEWVWLSRWLGTSPTGMPEDWQTFSLQQIKNEWAALEAAQKAFVEKLTEEQLDGLITYRNFKGEMHSNLLWQLLRHMVNHSTYHRGQITTMLRQLGKATVATDLVVYYRLQNAK